MSPAIKRVNELISWAGSSENLALYLTVESQFFLSNYEVSAARNALLKAGRPDLVRAANRQAKIIARLNEPAPGTTPRKRFKYLVRETRRQKLFSLR